MTHEQAGAYGSGRLTSARAQILKSARAMPGAFTVDELAASVRAAEPAAGATATVYRAVAALESAGTLERVGVREGAALYALCSAQSHHHHIVCDGCGATAHAECPVMERDTAPRADGFVITRHEVTLYGLCPSCAIGRDL